MFNRLSTFLYANEAIRYFKKNTRALPFPLALQIQTQSLCRGSCLICPHPELRDKQPQGIMRRELFEDIVEQVVREQLFAKMVFMLQNEPLLDKRILEWIKYYKSRGPGKEAVLCTNGEEISSFEPQEIAASGLDALIISLDAACPDTYRILHNADSYEKVLGNINSLLRFPGLQNKVILSFVLTGVNHKEVFAARAYWSRKGVKTRLVPFYNRAGALEKPFGLELPRGIMNFPLLLRRAGEYYVQQVLQVCPNPFYYMCVLFNGDVILCCNDWERNTVLGNVGRATLSAIWNSQQMNLARELMLKGGYEEIPACSRCSGGAFPRKNKAKA